MFAKKFLLFQRRWTFYAIAGLLFVYYISSGYETDVVQRATTLQKQSRKSANISSRRMKFAHYSGKDLIMAIANDTVNQGRSLLISVVNYAYLPLVHSWLCNTQFMNVHDQVLLIVTDRKSRVELEETWPNVNVVDGTEIGHRRSALNFSTVGYVRMMIYRTQLINKLLVNGVDVFLFEVDAVWFKNPIPDVRKRLGGNDVAVVLVTTFKNLFAGGLLYLRATVRTQRLWAELTKKMNQLGHQIKNRRHDEKLTTDKNDQMYLSSLLREKFANISITQLPGDVYADGKWYKDKDRNPNPTLINNNWVIGKDAKIKRAMMYNHWFWDMTSQTCDITKVLKISQHS